jgi:hypothetical protein
MKPTNEEPQTKDNASTRGEGVVEEPYVSPDVAAARDGAKVEMGKDLLDSTKED